MTRRHESGSRPEAGLVVPTSSSLWRVALGVALVVQLIVLYSPEVPGPPQVAMVDKVVHISIFAAPALAALMVGLNPPLALGMLAAHAPVSELIQYLALSQRSGDVFDVMADFAGVAIGGLAYVVWKRRQP